MQSSKKKILALIPARGGSKGIKNKKKFDHEKSDRKFSRIKTNRKWSLFLICFIPLLFGFAIWMVLPPCRGDVACGRFFWFFASGVGAHSALSAAVVAAGWPPVDEVRAL